LEFNTCSVPGELTVCSVIAAGTATIASVAATIQALRRGLGSLPDTLAHMMGILILFGVKFREFYFLGARCATKAIERRLRSMDCAVGFHRTTIPA
jgi:hypothetical protein